MKINSQIAETYAKNIFKKQAKGFEKKFLMIHTVGVLNTALKLSEKKNVNLESIKIACWLHDIGRTVDLSNHAKIGVEMIERDLGNINDIVKDCIINHGAKNVPETIEGKIVQLADKLSIVNDFKIFKMLFSDSKNKEESLSFLKKVEKDLLEILKKYDW